MADDPYEHESGVTVGELLKYLSGAPKNDWVCFGPSGHFTFYRVKDRGGVTQIEFNEIEGEDYDLTEEHHYSKFYAKEQGQERDVLDTGNQYPRVFLHTRPFGSFDWTNVFRGFARIPQVGEYIATDVLSSWFRVQLVVHTPFPCDCEAEVYAVEVDHMEAQQAAFTDAPWSGSGSAPKRD